MSRHSTCVDSGCVYASQGFSECGSGCVEMGSSESPAYLPGDTYWSWMGRASGAVRNVRSGDHAMAEEGHDTTGPP